MVYDVTKEDSLQSAERWIRELTANAEPNIIIMLVGNKIDLVEADATLRQVSKEEGEKLADDYKLMFEESSALQDTNVKSAFEKLLQSISKNY